MKNKILFGAFERASKIASDCPKTSIKLPFYNKLNGLIYKDGDRERSIDFIGEGKPEELYFSLEHEKPSLHQNICINQRNPFYFVYTEPT